MYLFMSRSLRLRRDSVGAVALPSALCSFRVGRLAMCSERATHTGVANLQRGSPESKATGTTSLASHSSPQVIDSVRMGRFRHRLRIAFGSTSLGMKESPT